MFSSKCNRLPTFSTPVLYQEGIITLEEVLSQQKAATEQLLAKAEEQRAKAIREAEVRRARTIREAEERRARAIGLAPEQLEKVPGVRQSGCVGAVGVANPCRNQAAGDCSNFACGACCKSHQKECRRHGSSIA